MPEQQRPDSVTIQMAASGTPVTASPSERVIEGLCVPYGPVGNSSLGAITFAQGSLTFAEVGRVKLLFQHDPKVSLGYALSLEERPDGLWGRFSVAEGADGDKALVEAAQGSRDGLSVGVLLDEEVLAEIVDKWIDGDTSATEASGRLLEVSQVSIPAFDDARIPSSAATSQSALSGHITLTVQYGEPQTPEATAPATQKENTMPETQVSAATPAQAEAPAAPAAQAATPSPAPNPAATSSTVVASEAPIYTFDGRGPSFVRDMWNARFSMDREAMDRVERFNQRWIQQDASQVGLVTAAVETRTTAPNFINQGYRPDLLVEVIDKGRPLVSRIGTVGLTDATPFRIPVEGEMTGGVGDHTEGQAHVAEGDLAVGDVTVTPGAISGAFRLSREVVDATNPALDKIALRAMTRNYQATSEAKVAAAFAAADGVATVSINTLQKVRQQVNDYYDLMLEDPSGIAAHPGFYSALLLDVDTTGRPMLASVNPMNAAATPRAGHTGADVDGVEIFKAYSVSANDAFLYRAEDVFLGESSLQTFRFEEVEGPGVIKLALWAYFVAKVTRAGSVVKVTSAATD